MRIPKAAGGPEKQVSTPTSVEAQRDNGPRRPIWLAALMLAAGVIVILVILAVVAYFVGVPVLQMCGADDADPMLLPLVGAEPHIEAHSSWSTRPQGRSLQLAHPVPYVVLKHTAGPRCAGLQQCAPMLRAMQELHWQRYDQQEISYNFLIDSDGNIYEGRGWNYTNPSRGIALRCNVDVALIGNYVEHNVTQETSSALRWLLDEGVSAGLLAADYRLLVHSQVKNTISPGRWALLAVAGWPHRCLQHCDRGAVCIRPADTDVTASR